MMHPAGDCLRSGTAVRVTTGTNGDLLVVPLPALEPRALGRWEAGVATAAFALGWTAEGHERETVLRFHLGTP